MENSPILHDPPPRGPASRIAKVQDAGIARLAIVATKSWWAPYSMDETGEDFSTDVYQKWV